LKRDKAHNDLKEMVRRIIDHHGGERQSITAGNIAEALAIKGHDADRRVRLIIEELLWPPTCLPVVAGSKGYFKPETWAEWQKYDEQMKDRIKETCKRKAQIRKNVYDYFYGNVRVKMI
jgi:hypothetical protein